MPYGHDGHAVADSLGLGYSSRSVGHPGYAIGRCGAVTASRRGAGGVPQPCAVVGQLWLPVWCAYDRLSLYCWPTSVVYCVPSPLSAALLCTPFSPAGRSVLRCERN